MELNSRLNISYELFSEIQNENDLNYDDPAMLRKLKTSIARGVGRIREWSSDMSLDIESDDDAKELLINYVRYSIAGMIDEFRVRYASDISALRLKTEARLHAAQAAKNQDVQ